MGDETRPTPLCLSAAVAQTEISPDWTVVMGEAAPISTARQRSNVLDIVRGADSAAQLAESR